jgi:hypothetical protein
MTSGIAYRFRPLLNCKRTLDRVIARSRWASKDARLSTGYGDAAIKEP